MPNANQSTADFKGVHVNVMMFGAKMNGVADDTQAFVDAWAALPIRGGTLHIPPGTMKFAAGNLALPPKSVILRGDGCVLPTNWANVTGSPAPTPISGTNGGSILWNAGSGPLFAPGTFVDCQISFRDLVFFGGTGVVHLGDSNTTINFTVEDCSFLWQSGNALELGTTDTTGNTFVTRIHRCMFFNCGIGVLSHANCDLTVTDCYCLQNNTHTLEIRGANARVTRNIFIGGAGTSATSDCDILLYPPANSLATNALYNVEINRNKFGNELSVPGETRVKISYGNAAIAAAHPDYWVGGVDVSHNHFIGTQATTGNPTSCIKLYSPCWNDRFADNDFQTATYAIDDSVVAESNISTGNSYTGNKHWFATTPFKAGGTTFAEISGLEYGPYAPATPSSIDSQPIENLLQVSEDFTGWSTSNLAFTAGQPDPLGGTGAYILTKTGAVATANQGFTPSNNGPVVFSIWLKAGSTNIATISINNHLSTTVFQQKFIGLDSQWRRYTIRYANASTLTGLAVSVFPDLPGATALDSIVAFGGQVCSGEEAHGYVKTAGSPVSSPVGLRSAWDISAAHDVDAGNNINAGNNLTAGNEALVTQGTVVGPGVGSGTGFSFIDLIQASSGFGARWTMSNDGSYRLQFLNPYPGTVIDTPLNFDPTGHLFVSTIAAQGNLCVLEHVYSAGQVPSFDAVNGLFQPRTVPVEGSPFNPTQAVFTNSLSQLVTGQVDLTNSAYVKGTGLTTGEILGWASSGAVTAIPNSATSGQVVVWSGTGFTGVTGVSVSLTEITSGPIGTAVVDTVSDNTGTFITSVALSGTVPPGLTLTTTSAPAVTSTSTTTTTVVESFGVATHTSSSGVVNS